MASLTDGTNIYSPSTASPTVQPPVVKPTPTVPPTPAKPAPVQPLASATVPTTPSTPDYAAIQKGIDDAKAQVDKIQAQITASKTQQPTQTPQSTQATPTSTPSTETPEQAKTLSDAQTQLKQANEDYQKQVKTIQDTMDNIVNGTVPLSAGEQAQVDGLKQSYQALIDQQALQNTGAAGVANIRGYQTGSAQYDPTFQAKTIGSIVTAGANKIADLNTKMSSAVATLEQAFKTDDLAAVKDQFDVLQAAQKSRTDTIQSIIDQTNAEIKAQQDAAQKVTDNINSIAEQAAKNGASPAIISAITSSGSMGNAIAAAGTSLQTSSNPDIAQYLFYKQQATNSGVVAKSFDDWQQAQAQLANSQAYSKAYATAAGSAAGAASIAGTDTTPTTDAGVGGILAATGLSYGAFLVLTGQMSSLSRDAATRNAALKQAQDYANKKGVDVSTLSSQYQALNKVISFNTTRQSMAVVQENEIQGTIKNLQAVSPTGSLSGLNFANVAKIWAGQNVNDPVAQQYAFHLEQLRNESVAYNLIAQGQINSDGSLKQATADDIARADQVIKNGISSGSLTGLQTAVQNSTDKMKPILQTSVSAANKAVWNLFGVGDKYSSQPSAGSSLVQQEKQDEGTVTDGLKRIQTSNPSVYKAASSMFTSVNPDTGQPYSASDILQAFPELQQ